MSLFVSSFLLLINFPFPVLALPDKEGRRKPIRIGFFESRDVAGVRQMPRLVRWSSIFMLLLEAYAFGRVTAGELLAAYQDVVLAVYAFSVHFVTSYCPKAQVSCPKGRPPPPLNISLSTAYSTGATEPTCRIT
jgi:hypothetical protein